MRWWSVSLLAGTVLSFAGCGKGPLADTPRGVGGAFSTGGVVETGGALSTGGVVETGGALSGDGAAETGDALPGEAGAVDARHGSTVSTVCCDDPAMGYCNCYEDKACSIGEPEVPSCPSYGHCCQDLDMPDFCTCWNLPCSDTIGYSREASGCP
jgi:hypothetical protein